MNKEKEKCFCRVLTFEKKCIKNIEKIEKIWYYHINIIIRGLFSMALIDCPSCGKQISDKALKCPYCSFEKNLQETENQMKLCTECGKEIEAGCDICPVCGCPVDDKIGSNENIQKVEVTGIKISKMSPKKRNTIIISGFLIFVILISSLVGSFVLNRNSKIKYQENLSLATSTMLLGAASAEEAGGLIHDVWYNTIYEKKDTKTDKFTKNKYGSFNDDFNTSLTMLMIDDDFIKDINSIKNNQELTNSIMKELVNPPEEFEEAYDKLQELYDSYLELTNLAVNPTGSLTSYTSNFNSADSAVSNAYKAMQRYIN